MNFSANNPSPLTLASISNVIDAIKATRNPLVEKMKAAGFDPDDGCFLCLPSDMYRKEDWEPFGVPDYVRFSRYVRQPMLARDPWPKFILPRPDGSAKKGGA